MPILYVAMINERRCVIVDAFGTSSRGDYKAQVLKGYSNFERWARKCHPLSAELNLSYRD